MIFDHNRAHHIDNVCPCSHQHKSTVQIGCIPHHSNSSHHDIGISLQMIQIYKERIINRVKNMLSIWLLSDSWVVCPVRGAGNDPEALRLAFHQSPTFMNTHNKGVIGGALRECRPPCPRQIIWSVWVLHLVLASHHLLVAIPRT